MEYRRLGKSGLRVSALSFGSWVTFGSQFDDALASRLMTMAYDSGVNFFDNAEVYADGQSEVIMGRVLRRLGWSRDTFCVSSKAFWGGERPTQMGLSRKHLFDACHAALKRLQVDYLDLYFCHRPDVHTPVEETVSAMSDLVRQGKILYWGTSEWPVQKIVEAYEIARRYGWVAPTMEQPEYNLFQRENVEVRLRSLYENYGLGTTTWSPLASGVLSGKYSHGIPSDSRFNVKGYEWLRDRYSTEDGKARLEKVRQLESVAQALSVSLPELAIAWCLRLPQVSTVILGASKVEQLEQNLKALATLPRLSPAVFGEIEGLMKNRPEELTDFSA